MHVGQELTRCRPGAILADIGFAVVSGVTAECTARIQGGVITPMPDGLRGVWVEGSDGRHYALVANFSTGEREAEVFGETIRLSPGTATVRVSGRP
jgi:hypothetical protein